jgi:excisionase family DNA binding protein
MDDLLPDPRKTPTLSIEQAGQILGIGRAAAYSAVQAGHLPTIKLGRRRIVVPTAALWSMLGLDPDAASETA